MLGSHKLIVDKYGCQIWDFIEPYVDESFQNWPSTFDITARYIIGSTVLQKNFQTIIDLAILYPGRIIFCHPCEGSEIIFLKLKEFKIFELVRDNKIGLISSGDIDSNWKSCQIDCYFSNMVFSHPENIIAQEQVKQYKDTHRKYKFLFLNGRLRPHRKYIIDKLREHNQLDYGLWTNLGNVVETFWKSDLENKKIFEPIRLLPNEYEIESVKPNLKPDLLKPILCQRRGFIKHKLFNDPYSDFSIINHRCYTDTWFSLVTETVFDYEYTFRTEKIWKPIMMAHPFIMVANRGYLRDLRKAGFKTFHSLIDESYDEIDNSVDRINAIVKIITWLNLNSNAEEFYNASQNIRDYNQQHLIEYDKDQRTEVTKKLQFYLDKFAIT